jgi:hypothetical protein
LGTLIPDEVTGAVVPEGTKLDVVFLIGLEIVRVIDVVDVVVTPVLVAKAVERVLGLAPRFG